MEVNFKMSYMNCSDWDNCTLCGECLMKCPVMEMEKDEAIFEFRQLLEGKPAPRVFKECTLCFNCNQFCPERLRPYELILQRIIEKRKKKVHAFLPYLVNGMPTGSLFQDYYSKMSREEKDILEKWSEIPPPGTKDVLWIGCLGKTVCYDIEHSKVLKDLIKFGPPDLCCGELAYRLVGWQCYVDVITRTLKRFEQLEIERMVCYCASCYNYFSIILPKVYGKKLPFKLISMYEWMIEKVEKGELKLKKQLDYKIAVSESCYVSELGPEFQKSLRKIYNAAGAELVELPHHGDQNISCGVASLARNPKWRKSLWPAQKAKRKDLKKKGLKDLALNCPGCYVFLEFMNNLKLKKKNYYYMPDELLRAYGDEITKPLKKILPGILKLLIKHLSILFKRVDIEVLRIPVDGPLPYNWKYSKKVNKKAKKRAKKV